MPRYKHISVGKPVSVEELRSKPRERKPSARQVAIVERDHEIERALNEAAALPESQALPIPLKPDQKLPTMRAAFARVMKRAGITLHLSARDGHLMLSRTPLSRRGGRRERA